MLGLILGPIGQVKGVVARVPQVQGGGGPRPGPVLDLLLKGGGRKLAW